MIDFDAVDPQWRIRYRPNNKDGDAGVWYTGDTYTDEAEALAALTRWREWAQEAKLEERWVTQWSRPEGLTVPS